MWEVDRANHERVHVSRGGECASFGLALMSAPPLGNGAREMQERKGHGCHTWVKQGMGRRIEERSETGWRSQV